MTDQPTTASSAPDETEPSSPAPSPQSPSTLPSSPGAAPELGRWTSPPPPSAAQSPWGQWTVPGSTPPLPRPRRRRGALVALAAVLTLLVAASGVLLVVGRRSSTSSSGSSRGSSLPASSPSSQPASISAFIPTAERFVEAHRGLRFKHPIPVTLLDDAAFRRLLGDQRQGQSDAAAVQTSAKELRALHLVPAGIDVGGELNKALGAGVSGFYDTKSRSLVVRGVAPTPYVRQVLVHELTHAVQDQWFGLDRPQLDAAHDESADAFKALVEGDAVVVENQYHSSMSSADQSAADREEAAQGAGVPSSIPHVLLELIAFPYQAGPRFVDAMRGDGGQARLDAAFRTPPTTSAEVLDPRRYLDRQRVVGVTQPPPAGSVYDTGVLGELGLLLVLEPLVTSGRLSSADAAAAAHAWGGDRYVAYDQGATTCLRVTMAADTADDEASLRAGLDAVARATPGATLAASGPVPATLTSCG